MTNSKKDSEDCYCNCHSPNSSAINCKHCVISPVLTYPSKDSELELKPHLVRLFRAGHADGQARIPIGNNLYQIDQTDKLIRAYISTHYITKEESDRRVLEARYQGAKDFNDGLVKRLTPAGISFEMYQAESLSKAIAETMDGFRELLKGDKE